MSQWERVPLRDEPYEKDPIEAVVGGAIELLGKLPVRPQRIEVGSGTTRIEIEWPSSGGTAQPVPVEPESPDETPLDEDVDYIRAPMVGTFYWAPQPGAQPFVAEDDVVGVGQQIGIIESMKLMTPLTASVAGTVCKVLVADATRVEFDQPLVMIRPSAETGQETD
ncbi:acetyl-CoA carboxylase biotin carboxyl carrier protein [Kibdelosporangium banguiense]|uniref:Biotin carboxyl carrier protein of acetyl-CoA carboxylase n=1 Tax=Kibdelosporangium banguiense TaxID=1365924 RepID=A0ABS4TFF1_9PSEU|nr:biotin/lipoyl-containing protein [Kibdelosporangium banguiense]MBP2323148.1 acetyl-CoA carboxylase biotin carboxyl carrier protein [Kibdelosporangium banguiense]